MSLPLRVIFWGDDYYEVCVEDIDNGFTRIRAALERRADGELAECCVCLDDIVEVRARAEDTPGLWSQNILLYCGTCTAFICRRCQMNVTACPVCRSSRSTAYGSDRVILGGIKSIE